MARIKIDGFRCERCGHEWIPRRNSPYRTNPKTCPKCKSAYWNEPRLESRAEDVTTSE